MPDEPPSMESLVRKAIALQGTELYVKVGKPPLVRVNARMRRLDDRVLDARETAALVTSITPENVQQEVQETGQADFTVDFEGGRLRVAVYTEHGDLGLVLRWIPDSK
jgi:twitching motility protein PilT